jgi:hypothetical protein
MKTLNKLVPVQEVVKMIEAGKVLVIAANEDILNQLPKGNWIGGTIPYFMDENGGCLNKKDVFVTDLSNEINQWKIASYEINNMPAFTKDRFSNGFSYILIPGFSEIHQKFSIDVYSYKGVYDVPLIGWVTGIDLNELGKNTPKVMNGQTGQILNNSAVVLHAQLPETKFARLEILNLFEQGNGESISFNESGFSCSTCIINGKNANLAQYIDAQNIDTRLPLVANYSGASINISIQSLDKQKGLVRFYAPLQKNTEYKFAKPVADYISEFNTILPSDTSKIIASCNCILNYLYSELDGKKTGKITGPFTFGEIAYVLVNQTLVYMSIEDK